MSLFYLFFHSKMEIDIEPDRKKKGQKENNIWLIG